MLKFIQILLFPFSVIYFVVLAIRHFLFDQGIFKSETFEVPVIGIGNLSFGGTGKSPFTSFLAKKLSGKGMKVAIVSRGYKRHTSGVIFCTSEHTAREIGDEPKMYVTTLKNVTVVVSENRSQGINALISSKEVPDVILLDDCYQHRKVTPSLLFLLTQENSPYWKDYLVPSGYLRDIRSASSRANALIITKVLSNEIHSPPNWKDRPVFRSKLEYNAPIPIIYESPFASKTICFSGLANDSLFISYLETTFHLIKSYSFGDHHDFTNSELMEIIQECQAQEEKPSIITTEKDAARLSEEHLALFKDCNLFILPIETPIVESEKFDQYLFSELNLME